jgi:anti-sigma factor (TIGR02949 family)
MSHNHDQSCKDVFAKLSEYLDHELAEGKCSEIEQHLADCPPCIEFLKSLKRTVSLCKDCEPVDPPPPLSAESREKMLAAYKAAIAKQAKKRTDL